ncbi:hypothetical protein [Pleionea sp. CnH1-48]|uniref:hypothetical protein n=1 Tax=Pleionea sp. CnH1-48 TaxID=2954494 RepID=UPI002097A17C|nr:hypothetical protein [Pleionea sp. CnH1-48]MCO7223207.1 hypothetical protein [Pleionea sp. CnH1-48]
MGSHTFTVEGPTTAKTNCNVFTPPNRYSVYSDTEVLGIIDAPTLPEITSFNAPDSFERNESADGSKTKVLSWTVEGADECRWQLRRDSGWSWVQPNVTWNYEVIDGSGTENETMTLKCWNDAGEVSESKDFMITPSTGGGGGDGDDDGTPAPYVSLTTELCNQGICGPSSIYVKIFTLRAESCLLNTVGVYNKAVPTNGRVLVSILTHNQIAQVTCEGEGGQTTSSIALPPPGGSFGGPFPPMK